jgi:hypothetical protein
LRRGEQVGSGGGALCVVRRYMVSVSASVTAKVAMASGQTGSAAAELAGSRPGGGTHVCWRWRWARVCVNLAKGFRREERRAIPGEGRARVAELREVWAAVVYTLHTEAGLVGRTWTGLSQKSRRHGSQAPVLVAGNPCR